MFPSGTRGKKKPNRDHPIHIHLEGRRWRWNKFIRCCNWTLTVLQGTNLRIQWRADFAALQQLGFNGRSHASRLHSTANNDHSYTITTARATKVKKTAAEKFTCKTWLTAAEGQSDFCIPNSHHKAVQHITTIITALRPLYRTTCVSRQLRLRTGGFC